MGMTLSNGHNAGLACASLVRGNVGQAVRDRIAKALLECCGKDTLAMVRVMEMLR